MATEEQVTTEPEAAPLAELADRLERLEGRLGQWAEAALEPDHQREGTHCLEDLRWVCSELRALAMSHDPNAAEALAQQAESFKSLVTAVESRTRDATTVSREMAKRVKGQLGELDSIVEFEPGHALAGRLKGVLVSVREAASEFDAQVTAIAEDVGVAGRQIGEIERGLHEAEEKSLRDELTGVGSRRAFGIALSEAVCLGQAQGPWCLVLVEADGVEGVNEAYGRDVGDALLATIARSITLALPAASEECTVGRYGGDKFGVLLQGTGLRSAAKTAEAIRGSVAASRWAIRGSKDNVLAATVSVGGTEYTRGDSKETIVERCRRAVGKAKAEGRNRVAIEEADVTSTLAARRAAMRGRL